MMQVQGRVENAQEIIEAWKKEFGLNDPLYVQYIRYLGNLVRFNFGYSLAKFPTTAWEVVKPALPWTLFLVVPRRFFRSGSASSSARSWAGARRPAGSSVSYRCRSTFTSIPYFMFGILLLYVVAFKLHWLPATGGYSRDVDPGWNLPFIKSVIAAQHPAHPLDCADLDGRLGARHARADDRRQQRGLSSCWRRPRGCSPSRVFFRYGIRSTILPALTALALGLAAPHRRLDPGRVHFRLSRHRLYAVPGDHHAGLHGDADDRQPDDHHHRDQRVHPRLCYPLIDPRITFRKSKA